MKFLTLGPKGSNHELVTLQYLDFHGLRQNAELVLAADFSEGALAVLRGDADYMIQCAVHPACGVTMAKFFAGLFAVDTFISPSRDLAIMQRNDVVQPRSLAAMRPTLDYIDVNQWDRIELVSTVAEVTRGLVSGAYAVGVGYAEAAQTHADVLRVTTFIGTVDDVWIVYGRRRLSSGRMLAWRDSPVGHLYREGA
ncbi:MAG: hypothetical protein EON54_03055 [Alcaligenaceae bacterium]|nr:MAG: hypothetical protein EON54_03055 [Alcaligenaceae bacterium]